MIGIDKEHRDCQPKDPFANHAGPNWPARVFGSFFEFVFAYYIRSSQVVYDGDKISIFGLISYNTETGKASFDHIDSIIGSKEGSVHEVAENIKA